MTDKQIKEKSTKNVVHYDAIWRQTVKYEKQSAKYWKECWGFMTDSIYDKSKNKKKEVIQLPEIANKSSNSVFPVIPNKKNPQIVNDLIATYQINRAMRYEPPVKKYTYPFSTSSEIGWPWYNNKNKIPDSEKFINDLPECYCVKKSVRSDSKGSSNLKTNTENESDKSNNNNNKSIKKTESKEILSENKEMESFDEIKSIDKTDDSINEENIMLNNKKIIEKLEKHECDKYRLGDPMKWWGGCMESLP